VEDLLKGCVDVCTRLGSCHNDLACDKHKKNDLRTHHAVDETREEFGLICGPLLMLTHKLLKLDGELNVCACNNVLKRDMGY